MPVRVLIAYDGSSAGEAVIGCVARVMPGAVAIVANVWEPPAAYGELVTPTMGVPLEMAPGPPDLEAETMLEQRLDQQAHDVARNGADLAGRAGLVAEPVVAVGGSVAETLCALAAEHRADVLALGHGHHHGRFGRLFGDVARHVIDHAGCAVLAVPLDR